MPVQPVRGEGSMSTVLFPLMIVLGADTVRDLRKKEIYPVLTLLCAAEGVVYTAGICRTQAVWILCAAAPGILVLLISHFSDGQIGKGDALVLWAVGMWTDFGTVWAALFCGTLMAAAFSSAVWLIRRGNREIPFVPFLTAGLAAVLFV